MHNNEAPEGVRVNGIAVSGIESDWLKPCFPHSGKAHFFARQESFDSHTEGRVSAWLSECGRDAFGSSRVPMFGGGGFERCKHCERILAKAVAHG